MGQSRRQFTDEFKREAVALLASSGRPLTQIAGELGVAPSMLRNWRDRSGGRNAGAAVGPNTPASAPHSAPDPAAEISRLRRDNDRLRMERDILKNCGHLLGTPEMRFRQIEDQRDVWPVRVMCDALSVSPSGYYAWRSRPESPRKIADRGLLGYPARSCSPSGTIWRAAHPCRAAGRGPHRQPQADRAGDAPAGIRARASCTTDSKHSLPVAANLLDQNFVANRPNQVWLADITYIPTGEGWLYLAVILDLFTRKAVGWAMRDHMRAELTIAALTIAIRRRRPGAGLIHHSDGSQYASEIYRALLADHGLIGSMG